MNRQEQTEKAAWNNLDWQPEYPNDPAAKREIAQGETLFSLTEEGIKATEQMIKERLN